VRTIALALLALGACSRPAPRAPTPVTTDDLWRFAPAGSTFSLVATGPAVTTGLATARAFAVDLRRLPHPQAADQLSAMLRHDGVDFLADGGPPELEPGRGIAMFGIGRDLVVLYPARDPAAFVKVARAGRVCRVHGAYAACAATTAQLDGLGSGGEAAVKAAAARPAHLRGAVELVEAGETPVTAVVDVERGVAEVRAHVGLPAVASAIPAVSSSALAARVRTAPASGALLLDLRAVLPLITAVAGPRAAVLSALRGDVAAVMLAGPTPRGWVMIGIANPAAVQQIIDGCDGLSSPGLELRPQGGRCLITPEVAGVTLPSLEARLDGDVVVIETPGALAADGTPAPEITALLAAPAFLATWGRGVAWRPALAATEPTGQRGELEWLADRVDELGLVVRPDGDGIAVTFRIGSVYRSSDEVLARLAAILTVGQPADAVTRGLEAVAHEHPQSPLARSVTLGPGGTLLPFGVLGVAVLLGIGAIH
jgi:hypothetical protein